jgi:hypothetical protein
LKTSFNVLVGGESFVLEFRWLMSFTDVLLLLRRRGESDHIASAGLVCAAKWPVMLADMLLSLINT